MKKTFLFVAGMCAMLGLQAQTPGQSGIITYEEKVKFELHIQGDMPAMMDSLPKERVSRKSLTFNQDAALYRNVERSPEEMQEEGGGMRIMIRETDDQVYSDLKNMTTTEQREFMSRMFLISTDLKRHQWKLTGQQKTIAGYPCQQAMNSDTSLHLTVWFTPLIPLSCGPGGFGNLPGMILEMNFEDGERIITAKSVEIKPIDGALLKKPAKGKKVSREEFKAIVDEKMKEMGAEGGEGGPQMIIRIQR